MTLFDTQRRREFIRESVREKLEADGAVSRSEVIEALVADLLAFDHDVEQMLRSEQLTIPQLEDAALRAPRSGSTSVRTEVRKFVAMEASYFAFRLSMIALRLDPTERRKLAAISSAAAIQGDS